MATDFTGGQIEGASRIASACFVDGNDDELIIEFWHMPGSILRTQYNRRTTVHTSAFVPVHCWEFRELTKLANAN